MSFPVIGIPCTSRREEPPTLSPVMTVGYAYLQAIADAGGVPVLIPLGLSQPALEKLAGRLDGLLLAGGGDIAPRFYGAEPHPKTNGVDEQRDEAELLLAGWAMRRDVPLLAICRGIQVLNVAAGGTLYQDIASECPQCIKHDRFYPTHPLDELAHSVELKAGSRLAGVFGQSRIWVNSRHHQAARRLGAGLVATAWAEDGICEGLELPGARFCVGVQWHPENLRQVAPATAGLFAAFIEAAGG